MIYHGILQPFEKLLTRSPLVPWAYLASNFYHNVYWYPLHGKRRAKKMLEETEWGALFRERYGGQLEPTRERVKEKPVGW